jgi:hypothetical protein
MRAQRVEQGLALGDAADPQQLGAVGGQRERGRGAHHADLGGHRWLVGDVEFDVRDARGLLGEAGQQLVGLAAGRAEGRGQLDQGDRGGRVEGRADRFGEFVGGRRSGSPDLAVVRAQPPPGDPRDEQGDEQYPQIIGCSRSRRS